MSKRAETIGQRERDNTMRVSMCDALVAVATVSQRQNIIYDDKRRKTEDPSERATENEHAREEAGESHRALSYARHHVSLRPSLQSPLTSHSCLSTCHDYRGL